MNSAENMREAMRRQCVLQILNENDPEPILDKSILFKIQSEHPHIQITSVKEIRKILKYLEGHLLAMSSFNHLQNPEQSWTAIITSRGVDYLAGYGAKLDGVARDA